MKNVTFVGSPTDFHGALTIESYAIPYGSEETFNNRLMTNHVDAALVVHGLHRLVTEGSHHELLSDELPRLPAPFEHCDLSRQTRQVLWLRVQSKNGKEHLAGMLEWRALTKDDAILTGIYVLKQFRRRELGTLLLIEALRQMRERDFRSTLALVPERNWIAGHFLASRDFHLVLRSDVDTDELRIHSLDAPRCFYRSLLQGVLFPEACHEPD